MDSNGKLTLDLPRDGAAAMFNLLRSTGPKGRVDIRLHARLYRALYDACRVFKNEDQTEFGWKPGKVELTDVELVKFFVDMLDDRTRSGIPGELSEGYEVLIDSVDVQLADKG